MSVKREGFRPLMGFLNFKLELYNALEAIHINVSVPLWGFLISNGLLIEFSCIQIKQFPSPYGVS